MKSFKHACSFCAMLFLLHHSASAQNMIYSKGALLDEAKYNEIPSAPDVKGFIDLPSSASLKMYCPTPGDQNPYGTCVAWASSYGARTILYCLKNNIVEQSLKDYFAFSPYYVYSQLTKNDYDCNDGSFEILAAELMHEKGSVMIKDFPMSCGSPVTSDMIEAGKNYRITDYFRLDDLSAEKSIIQIKRAINADHPVIYSTKTEFYPADPAARANYYKPRLGIDNTSFTGNLNLYSPVWILTADELAADSMSGGHCMTIVGYDDYMYGGAFEVMNSWGTNWGSGGFFWMPYDTYTMLYNMTFVGSCEIIEDPDTDGVPQDITGCLKGDCYSMVSHYVDPDGWSYEGEFLEGAFTGKGIMIEPDGTKYEGVFLNGYRHGHGKVTLIDGTEIEGEFEWGAFLGE